MKILFAADHAGFNLKQELLPFVRDLGYEVEDWGAFEYNEQDDYPDIMVPVAKAVAREPDNLRGIIIGGSGQGEAMAANRVHNARAIVFNGQYKPENDDRYMPNEIVISKLHNNANILSLGARFLNLEEAKRAVKLWLESEFNNEERHVRRIRKIEKLTSS